MEKGGPEATGALAREWSQGGRGPAHLGSFPLSLALGGRPRGRGCSLVRAVREVGSWRTSRALVGQRGVLGDFVGDFCAFLLVCLKFGVWAFALQETKTNK